jgi:hypothetical protein
MFFATAFLGKPKQPGFDEVDDGFRQAAKYGCLGWFIAGATSGAVIDLGLPFFAFAAFACASPARRKVAQLPRFQNAA